MSRVVALWDIYHVQLLCDLLGLVGLILIVEFILLFRSSQSKTHPQWYAWIGGITLLLGFTALALAVYFWNAYPAKVQQACAQMLIVCRSGQLFPAPPVLDSQLITTSFVATFLALIGIAALCLPRNRRPGVSVQPQAG